MLNPYFYQNSMFCFMFFLQNLGQNCILVNSKKVKKGIEKKGLDLGSPHLGKKKGLSKRVCHGRWVFSVFTTFEFE